ncbi:hypothetical protein B0T25DRAFT_457520, partial [Lasiosphaeria hispida]
PLTVLIRDMYAKATIHLLLLPRSPAHYNSFHTPFFIPLVDYPLAEDDVRRQSSFQNANLDAEFGCWRCGEAFGRKFSELKKHLEIEFQLWKAE